MAELSERLNRPISTSELERRWAAVRAAMEAEKIDVLLMQNNNDHMGGYVKYFTDMPAANGYPMTVVFPRDDGMSVVGQGPMGMVRDLPPEGDGIRRGVKTMMTTPSYASAHYTKDYDPELAARALAPYASGTIGLVGTYQMSFAMVDHMKSGNFSNTKFVDATDMVDRIKVLKSPEELDRIRETAAMQDSAMEAAFAAVKPGMRDSDVAAVAQFYGQQHGSEQGIFLCASAPMGTPCMFGPRHVQDRIIEDGDQLTLLVENNGAGGYFTELGRTCVLGQASQELKDEFEFTLEARKFTLDRLTPGTPAKDIWDAYNSFMDENGRPQERRLYCHGQGYDMVERPLVRHDEPMAIQANTNIVVHPTYILERVMSWICDNYIIGEDGPGERLHSFPEKITEL
ncbi:MAG: aminopeptidase P family protein [Rhodospirillaceae bacterium]|nr:aminopeptidase P family protein [Rhodospirillaceae bacterium]MBT5457166.1 aminopeptidase P family protein [Rhodospirillaceae bacterium]